MRKLSPKRPPRIAFGGIHTECSTYSALRADRDDFSLTEGQALTTALGLDWSGCDAVPIFHARALPGGIVRAQTYLAFRTDFLRRLAAAMPLDGLLLIMHGAMVVEGIDDAEADWINAARAIVGPDCLIAASYDLHGNVSPAVIDALDIFAAYRTAPHVDVSQTHHRAQRMLLQALESGYRPGLAYVPIPMLWPGERTSTRSEPSRSLYASLPERDKRPGILDSNLMIGYVWADEPRATACAIVTGLDPAAASVTATDLARECWNRRADFEFENRAGPLAPMLADALAAVAAHKTPVVLADSGDNPTGGGVGDRSDVLKELLRHDVPALVAGIADPTATRRASACGIGNACKLTIGFDLDPCRSPLVAEVRVEQVVGVPGAMQALVRIGNVQVILTERRQPFHHLRDFQHFGIDPAGVPLLVVKSGYLEPEIAAIASTSLLALTDGAVCQHIPGLGNQRRARGIYPFEDPATWTPKVHLSARWWRH